MAEIAHQNLEDEKDIFDTFETYYDLNPNNISIKIPYDFNSALERIQKLSLEAFTNNLNKIVQKEIDYESNKNLINFSINNILFLTSTISATNDIQYILLNDLKKENYIIPPKFSDNLKEALETGMNLRIITKEDGQKELYLKCIVDYDTFTNNIINNLINKSSFDKSKTILDNSLKYKNKELINKDLEFDMKIFCNSINKIMYTDKGEYILDLQFPPKFRTNFLIDVNKRPTTPDRKKSYTYYENIMFPFRNFQDEIAN